MELTWTNKALRLLAHDDGTYVWVSPVDFRVAEVRLLHDVAAVGEVGLTSERAADNLLIRGDALHALTSLAELPELSAEYLGKVGLAYLDPPFNTQQSFLHYDDALEHSVWLSMMRDRLLQVKRLLSPDGSVWVHLDDSEMAYCRVMMDEVFGRENFVATVLWQKVYSPKSTAKQLSVDQDYIHVYAKDGERWRANSLPRSAEMDARYINPDNDSRGVWKPGDLAARNFYSLGRYPITCPSGRIIPGPPRGSYYRVSEERFRELDSDGRIWWGKAGDNVPAIKRFLDDVQLGRVPQTWWPYNEVDHSQAGKKEIKALLPDLEPFSTPKPERLLHRIVHIATNPGDIVLDPFVGSGTTAAVAHKMGRRWVAIEREAATMRDYAVPRLTKVVDGEDAGGVTEETRWQGGGGFRVIDVAPSMFEEDAGRVVLADWAINGRLAEATAAQLGYDHSPEPPFCGRKGRTRLAVVDGLVNEAVVALLVGVLPEGELLTVCGTAVDPDARQVLREARPGSTLKKIPASLLSEYRSPRRRIVPEPVPVPVEATQRGGTTQQPARRR